MPTTSSTGSRAAARCRACRPAPRAGPARRPPLRRRRRRSPRRAARTRPRSVDVDHDRRVARGKVRRDGRGERIGIAVGQRHVKAVRGRECGDVGGDVRPRPHARRDRLHARGAHAGGRERLHQRRRDAGLAHTGVGAGDEESACRRHQARPRPGRASRTIGWPSALASASPFHACPYTTSNVAGMRAVAPHRFAALRQHALPARGVHQAMRAPARRIGRAQLLQLAQQRPGVLVGQRDLFHVHHRIGETGVRPACRRCRACRRSDSCACGRRRVRTRGAPPAAYRDRTS